MLKRFIRYYRPHRTIFILDMLASLLVALVGITYPIITREMLNELIPNREYRMIVFAGVGLLILYGAVSVLHQILEPKLVGKSLGLHPLLTLAASYVGFKAFGIVGMAVAPLLALLGKSLLCRDRADVSLD